MTRPYDLTSTTTINHSTTYILLISNATILSVPIYIAMQTYDWLCNKFINYFIEMDKSFVVVNFEIKKTDQFQYLY